MNKKINLNCILLGLMLLLPFIGFGVLGSNETIDFSPKDEELGFDNLEKNLKTSSANTFSTKHERPVSILVYNEFTDKDQEFVNTMSAIETYYNQEFHYENLTDYNKLDSKLSDHHILLILEQENTNSSITKKIGNEWATSLNNFVDSGGVVILTDFRNTSINDVGLTSHIYNNSGLMEISGFSASASSSTLYQENSSSALARGISTEWTTTYSVSFTTTDYTYSIVDDGTNPVVAHKVMGKGHIVLLGFDMFETEGNCSTILANSIRLHNHIVFDESHSPIDKISTTLANFSIDLVSEGFGVTRMDNFNSKIINSADILFLTASDVNYTTSEADIIEGFIKRGKGLYLATEWTEYGDGLDPVLTRFNVKRNKTASIHDSDDYIVETNRIKYDTQNILNHSSTLMCSNVEFYKGTGFIEYPSSSIKIVTTDNDGTATWGGGLSSYGHDASNVPVSLALTTSGNGRIVIFGDTGFMNDVFDADSDGITGYHEADNKDLAMNSMIWVSAAGNEEHIVLMDESHNPRYSINGAFSTFAKYLIYNGYTVKWMTTFHTDLFSNSDILFISEGLTNYSSSEVNSINSFVKKGKDLFLVGDWGQYNIRTNKIANSFGIKFNTTEAYLKDSDDGNGGGYINYQSDNINKHPVTKGISRIEIARGTGFDSLGGGISLIETDDNDTTTWSDTGYPANNIPIITAKQYHSGQLVVFTDLALIMDNLDPDGDGVVNFFDSDNELLTLNSFEWFKGKAPDVIVNNPTDSQFCNKEVPSFNITIANNEGGTMWYKIGTDTKTITSLNGTIDETIWENVENGSTTITFYGKNSYELTGSTSVNINVDLFDPVITILSPEAVDEFGSTPPKLSFKVNESNLDSMWYRLNGEGNYTLVNNTSINSTVWEGLTQGEVTIKVFANDLAGNVGSKTVLITKKGEAIPGYNLSLLFLMIFSTLGVISVLSYKKISKSK
jgi:hypothetical protein